MTSRRVSTFADEQLAARIEAVEAAFMARSSECAATRYGTEHFQLPVSGGFATYAGPDSPFNKVAGVGFDGIPGAGVLDTIESRYAEHGAPVQFEVSILADPALVELLTARGYRLVSFENVLVRPLDDDLDLQLPTEIGVSQEISTLREWLDVVVAASSHPDTTGLAQHESFPLEALEQAETAMIDAGVRPYLARISGAPAGGAGVRFDDGIAQMTGAATLPAHRRRGVQTALVAHRLADARAAGCTLAVVTTQPGSPSHANTQKMGFDLAYTRAVLVNSPDRRLS